MKRYISVLAPTIVAAAFLFPVSAFAATTWFVNAGAAPNGDGTTLLTATTTIQAAVNAAAPGDTINVSAGTYDEHVAVNKSLTFNGANAGTIGSSTSRVAESIVDGTDNGTPFAITANNVTIDGFTVKNGSNGGLFSGIWSQTGTLNSSILNNIITQNGFGVWAQCGGNCLIQGNLFDSNNKPNSPGSGDISADSTTGLTINNNEFKNDTAGNPILMQAVAPGAHTNLVVSNNNFHGNTNSNAYVLAVNGGTFSGNTIIPASDATGISFSGADANITVTGNTITGGARGVRVEDAGYYGANGGNSNITVNRNSVATDSTYGVGNESGYTGSVDATCNWWGSASGPGSVGPGTGSPVTSNVTFQPWLTTSDLNSETDNCNGPLPANSPQVHIFKYIDGVQATAANASSTAFPMLTTFTSSTNGNVVDAPFTLSPTGWGPTDAPYEASYVGGAAGDNYAAHEVTSGNNVVGASCTDGKPFALGGYSTGDTLSAAFTNASSTATPSFTNLQSDKYVIVWNKTCQTPPPPQCTVNATQTIVSDTATQVDSHDAVAVTPHPAWTTISGATWVYNQALDANGSSPTGTKVFTRTFTIAGTPADSSLVIAADNTYTVSVNGHAINTGTSGTDLDNFSSADTWTIPAADLLTGSNTITFTVTNTAINPATGQPFGDPNPGGLLYKLTINNCVTAPPPGTASISGIKFEDWDADKSPYESKWEIKLSGWTIYLDTNNNGALDPGETSTTTDSHGAYTFSGLAAGTYYVREVQQPGWVGITPVSGLYTVTLAAGQKAKNKNFGNFKLGSISGLKFNDLNGNHKKDAGEPALSGWTINLTGPHGYASTTVTDASGHYSFTGLMQGTYKLSEVMQTGWKQTVHPGNVKINSNTNAKNKNFGNKLKVTGNPKNDKDDGKDIENDD